MAKKIKKNRSDFNGRSREKMRRALKRLDKISALLLLVCFIATALVWNKPYDLGTTNSNGYPALFLLTLAFLPLELYESVMRFIEMPEAAAFCGTFTALACSAFLTIFFIWLFVRFIISSRYGINGVKISATLMKILAIWGFFQLFCYLLSVSFDENDDDAVRKQMKQNIPAKVSGKTK